MARASDNHDYRACYFEAPDRDCPRFPCRVYREGFRDGDANGYSRGYYDGYAKGYADGYNAGYKQGFQDGIAACPRDHSG